MLGVAKVRTYGWFAPTNQFLFLVYAESRVPYGGDTQFQTPTWCAEYMARLVPPNCRTILEPTPGVGNLVRALADAGFEITAPDGDFWREIDSVQRFDCVVMNPPFSPPSDAYAFLERCMTMSDNIIALMPWLTLINSNRRAKQIEEFGLVSAAHLPRSTFPGTRVQCCILEMRRGYRGETSLRFIWQPHSRT